MVDMYGTPDSPALHVVEHGRLVNYEEARDAIERNIGGNGATFDPAYRGKLLQLHFTVEDEGVFTTPWTATITYRPNVGGMDRPYLHRKHPMVLGKECRGTACRQA